MLWKLRAHKSIGLHLTPALQFLPPHTTPHDRTGFHSDDTQGYREHGHNNAHMPWRVCARMYARRHEGANSSRVQVSTVSCREWASYIRLRTRDLNLYRATFRVRASLKRERYSERGRSASRCNGL